jgi:hypothetical protein
MRKSCLSVCKLYCLVKIFVSGSTARAVATLVGANKSTVACFYDRINEIVVQRLMRENFEAFDDETGVEEIHF